MGRNILLRMRTRIKEGMYTYVDDGFGDWRDKRD